MADTKAQQEPSMEEILASIRRIIAEDHDPAAAPVAEAPSAPPPPAAPPALPPFVAPPPPILEPIEDDDVLELTNFVAEEPEPVRPPPIMEEPAQRFRVDMDPPPAPRYPIDEDRLLSSAAASASAAAFSSMSSQLNRRRSSPDMMMGNAGLTLEEIVRDELRPLLRAWLDAHLPHLVERLVREELERVARDAF